MLRLAKYLKPFIPLLLIAIVLLFVQAVSDLSLPNYLSKIVNVGIQQGGVENAVAKAVRQSEMDRLTLFMTDSDKALVLQHYTLVEQRLRPTTARTCKQYPGAGQRAGVRAQLDHTGRKRPAQPHPGQSLAGGGGHRAGDGRPGQGGGPGRRVRRV